MIPHRAPVSSTAKFPTDMRSECEEWRAKMIEAAAEANEELLNKYLEHGDLSEAEIKRGLRERSIRNEIVALHVRLGIQEQRRAGNARCNHRVHACADRDAAGERSAARRQGSDPQGKRR